jgi:hypothetical protein
VLVLNSQALNDTVTVVCTGGGEFSVDCILIWEWLRCQLWWPATLGYHLPYAGNPLQHELCLHMMLHMRKAVHGFFSWTSMLLGPKLGELVGNPWVKR